MYTIKSKSKTPSDFQAYNTQWIRCGQRCMLCDLSTQIASIQVYNRFTVDLKDFPTVQINTSHIYSIIPSSNRGISQAKIILKCINIHSGSDLRLRSAALWDTTIKFSLQSRAMTSPVHLVWEAKGNPWVDFLMVIMASGIARGRVRTTVMTESRNMTAIIQIITRQRRACSLDLLCTSLILDIHVMINWHLSK